MCTLASVAVAGGEGVQVARKYGVVGMVGIACRETVVWER